MQIISKATFGCDPEVFVRDEKRLLSIVGRVGGTKDAPLQITGLPLGFAVQEDNVAVEFCVPPASSAEEFVNNVQRAVAEIQAKYLEKQGLKLAFGVSSELFDEDQLQTQAAQTFGCDPDFNVYTMEHNPRPDVGDALGKDGPRLRTAGGHIHFGWDNPDDEQRQVIIRAADLVLGTASVFLDPDSRRMMLYGKAGACRLKPYGAEYRTLSNFWLSSEKLMKFIAGEAERTVEFANKFADRLMNDALLARTVERGINQRRVATLEALRNEFGLPSVKELSALKG